MYRGERLNTSPQPTSAKPQLFGVVVGGLCCTCCASLESQLLVKSRSLLVLIPCSEDREFNEKL